jgi:glycosidase
MKQPKYPSLYQINTRVWITEISEKLGRRATLDDIPDKDLDRLAEMGFDYIWLLSVWRTGEAAQKKSRENKEWRKEFEETLTDLREEDIAGSGFAITGYDVHPILGGNEALKRIRDRLSKRNLKLMLDFVPNHMAPDHPWVEEHPDYFVSGTETDITNSPQNYTHVKNSKGDLTLAYGRDPYFAGWPDTLQLDYSNPATVEAMMNELLRISGQCDGVRCDMAMLVLPEVFERTWGKRAQPFWPIITKKVREKNPGFTFMAEVYWDLEWTLQQQGFDFAYDKKLYDRLCKDHAKEVREHFYAGLDYQDKMARFLENHDEPRTSSTFPDRKHKAAAVITYFSPGLRFFHQGQFEGRTKRISPHLVRAPQEPVNEASQSFYNKLLSAIKKPVFRDGSWQLLQSNAAWEGNNSWESFVAFAWKGKNDELALVVINYAPQAGQCYLPLTFPELAGRGWRLKDLMSDVHYDRPGNDLVSRGLYLDLPPWGYHVFEIINLNNGLP